MSDVQRLVEAAKAVLDDADWVAADTLGVRSGPILALHEAVAAVEAQPPAAEGEATLCRHCEGRGMIQEHWEGKHTDPYPCPYCEAGINLSGAAEKIHDTMKRLEAVRQQHDAQASRIAALEGALTATDPINGDYAAMLAEVAKNVCYWRGKDFCMPDQRDYREASSHLAVICKTLSGAAQ